MKFVIVGDKCVINHYQNNIQRMGGGSGGKYLRDNGEGGHVWKGPEGTEIGGRETSQGERCDMGLKKAGVEGRERRH